MDLSHKIRAGFGYSHVTKLYSWMRRARRSLASYDSAPSPRDLSYLQDVEERLQSSLDNFNHILNSQVPQFNQAAKAKNLPIILAGKPVKI